MDIRLDRVDDVRHAEKVSAPELLGGEMRKPEFDQIQPRRTGRDEVQMHARVLPEPRVDLRVFVRRVVVHDQMQVDVRRRGGVDLGQKAAELLWRWRGMQEPRTVPSRTLKAANSVVVPWRL